MIKREFDCLLDFGYLEGRAGRILGRPNLGWGYGSRSTNKKKVIHTLGAESLGRVTRRLRLAARLVPLCVRLQKGRHTYIRPLAHLAREQGDRRSAIVCTRNACPVPAVPVAHVPVVPVPVTTLQYPIIFLCNQRFLVLNIRSGT